MLGSITLRCTAYRDYKPEALELIRVLADQAALAIQLTRLAEEAKQAAILEERNRMACEIHDTLAQSFTSIRMQLEAAIQSKPKPVSLLLKDSQSLVSPKLGDRSGPYSPKPKTAAISQ